MYVLYVSVCICTYMYVCKYMYVLYVFACIVYVTKKTGLLEIHAYTCTYIRTYIYMHILSYTCIYMHIHAYAYNRYNRYTLNAKVNHKEPFSKHPSQSHANTNIYQQYIHIPWHTYTYIYLHIYAYIHIPAYTYNRYTLNTQVSTDICSPSQHRHMPRAIPLACMYMHIFECICMYMYVYVCIALLVLEYKCTGRRVH